MGDRSNGKAVMSVTIGTQGTLDSGLITTVIITAATADEHFREIGNASRQLDMMLQRAIIGERFEIKLYLPTMLTQREMQVARLVAIGQTNADVARELTISVHTVESHLKHIYGKLNVSNRSGLAHKLSGGGQ